ncbi:hypothetical protein BO82DRAFT_359310 [Aspergillus uvarum CBS 121591]|uniref:Secreted protein n=1 Tax=Aspergillus uvarum CBS 121591 TaxID=1448315 RepID=A0A319BU83_9EURO|nr:hypothetical protein BO82DRAFT_359310 [Aspergillus uvarum CBS 121591]PYH76275.1 hypothetical protein BO82DRAFT_359310 [Aspergillus uvarum CBS 121591]
MRSNDRSTPFKFFLLGWIALLTAQGLPDDPDHQPQTAPNVVLQTWHHRQTGSSLTTYDLKCLCFWRIFISDPVRFPSLHHHHDCTSALCMPHGFIEPTVSITPFTVHRPPSTSYTMRGRIRASPSPP